MKKLSLLSCIAASLFLTGCFETAEEIEARRTQFNGMALSDVTARIGAPDRTSSSQAVWTYENTFWHQYPIYGTVGGKRVVVNYSRTRVTHKCTYTAALKSGRVVESLYEGNYCNVFSPKLG